MQHLHVVAPNEQVLGLRTRDLVQDGLLVLCVDRGTRGILLCNGTARRPVVFTTMLDDSQGGDTNGDRNWLRFQ